MVTFSLMVSNCFFCSIPCDTTYTNESAPRVSKTLLNKTVCVIGLGYVGLPLAETFSKYPKMIGYRRNQEAVDELNATPGNNIEAITLH